MYNAFIHINIVQAYIYLLHVGSKNTSFKDWLAVISISPFSLIQSVHNHIYI